MDKPPSLRVGEGGWENEECERRAENPCAFMCKKRYNLVAASICISEKKRV
jgi:hypothetical protein